METLFSASYVSESDWFDQPSQPTRWTKEENKLFESALAIYGEGTPERWIKVAAMIPGKTVTDVIKQYRELEEDVCDIEAGKVPIPGYLGSPFTPSDCGGRDFDGSRKRGGSIIKDGGGGGGGGGAEMERKKGVPWTEEEHKRFLMGLLKYGKGDWRNISRNFVISKTPTQVASHAQKYFIRQLSIGKDKRRPSIHDITTVNLSKTTTKTTPSGNHQHPPTFDPSNVIQWHQRSAGIDELGMIFDSSQGNLFMPSSFEIASSGIKLQGQSLYGNAYLEARIKHQSSVF